MAKVDTNSIALAFADEDSPAVWETIELNTPDNYGAELTTVPREPISEDLQNRKGVPTDLTSGLGFQTDTTMSLLRSFVRRYVMAIYRGAKEYVPSVTSTTAFTVDNVTTATLVPRTLVYARGMGVSSNNGLKTVGVASTTTSVVVTESLVEESTVPTAASLRVAGLVGAVGDLSITVTGSEVKLVSATANLFKAAASVDEVFDLIPGMAVFIGGTNAVNKFSTDANFGYALIKSVSDDGTEITLINTTAQFVTDAGAGQQVHVYFGKTSRNVSVSHADFYRKTLDFELAFQNLEAIGTAAYEYAEKNLCNEWTLNVPLTNKSTSGMTFIGTDAKPPIVTRRAGASTPTRPQLVQAISTAIDIGRLRLAEVDTLGTQVDFKNLTMTLTRNISAEKSISNLEAIGLNLGRLGVTYDAQMIYSDKSISEAIRNNLSFSLDFSLRNDDGAAHFTSPSVTLGDGGRDFPVNESVLINTTITAFGDPVEFDTTLMVTLFPWVPKTDNQT